MESIQKEIKKVADIINLQKQKNEWEEIDNVLSRECTKKFFRFRDKQRKKR